MADSRRSVPDIRVTGAAWVTETELAWLCDQASLLRRIRQWDVLNPPPDPVPAPFGDLPYWIAEMDRVL